MEAKRMERIKTVPAYEHVCAQIRRAIHLGEYVPGDRLPSERDLSAQLGVSRVTVREAIRVLEAEGYVRSSGRGGGGRLVIAALHDDPEGAPDRRHAWLLYLRRNYDEIESLFDFRHANESYAARLAAARRSDDHLQKLRESLEALRVSDNIPAFRQADSMFHLVIADASANSYLRKAVEDARADMFLPVDAADFDVNLTDSVRHHTEIIEAIETRDPERAEAAMAKHIETSRVEIRSLILGEEAEG
jgi:DNA-binding FadR family transcriptional regulator